MGVRIKQNVQHEEIIIYCGVGGYTSTGYFVIHSLLGYRNVKFYDGSAQAWVLEHDMEL
ncbi:rhodanese-like domain-containing protein [Natronoflexus pectinivorans]|uniref:Rhodanese-like domain-containing protein n=1 Tax=Natronoflexus pectinivorans TaxID=682526 RepID=A0A4R2GK80_9BACT|nr:rhodanese-like domain-containing protein [Natronoflexus pectinivorans]